jgi:hypothetical protein
LLNADEDIDGNGMLRSVTARGASKSATSGLDDRENEADQWMDSSERERMSRFIEEDDFDNSDDDEDLGVDLAAEGGSGGAPVGGDPQERSEEREVVLEGDDERSALLREALGADAKSKSRSKGLGKDKDESADDDANMKSTG